MNNTFTFTRFALLFKKQFVEHLSTYLMSAAVLLGILAVMLGFSAYADDGNISIKTQFMFFMTTLMFSSVIFTSTVFSDLGDKRKAIPVLTLPVSHLEKYLVAWLYSFVVFFIVFLGCFYFVDILVIWICNATSITKSTVLTLTNQELKPYRILPAFAILHALAFCGAIFFEKLHLIKTAFTTLLFILAIVLLNQPLVKMIFGREVRNTVPFEHVGVIEGDTVWYVLSNDDSRHIVGVLVVILVLILWTSTYFKLKEKEV
ncbi:MAG: hypothetical protein EOO88_14035 [Pedobacter sp.]|nr:MAG: hypothetical protein EOO88_14035 [Pedobacter sp.]